MRHFSLPKQDNRTIHTPAIFDSPFEKQKTRANAGFQQSTADFEAVHICGLPSKSLSAKAVFSVEAQQ
ncbi:hypothetical protein [Duganella sp. Root1480D1]|uniref:hypothetical protein n=1 Tax=Duganella sp. Root1480D1 TaxID=1736471 RepID=UPI00070AF13A|nr:hypothetical protein [Duganella sp. Root1480D1]KQZ39680.1 hypothetical protein ASD58_04625 [Duganella sp. Root1480D1]